MTNPQQPNPSQPYGAQQGQPQAPYNQPQFGQQPGQQPGQQQGQQQAYFSGQTHAVRSRLSGMKNSQLFVGAIAIVAIILWLFRNLNWIVLTDKGSADSPKVLGIDGGGEVSFFEAAGGPDDFSFQIGMAGIYTGALLFLMLLTAVIAIFSIHYKAALRLATVSLIAYFVLTIFQFFIPLFGVMSSEDAKEDVGVRPGVGIILTWLFLLLIVGGAIYFSSQTKKAAQSQQGQPQQFGNPHAQPYGAPFQSTGAQGQPTQNAWAQSPQQPQQPQQGQQPWGAPAAAATDPAASNDHGTSVAGSSAPATETPNDFSTSDEVNPWATIDDDSEDDNKANPWA